MATAQRSEGRPRLFRPAFHHDPRALPQRGPRRWPARNHRPVGRFGYLKVVYPSDVFGNAAAYVVPDNRP